MKNGYKIAIVSILVMISCCLTIGSSYALWTISKSGSDNVMTTGCFELTLKETETSEIHLTNAYPIPDEQGLSLQPYTVTVTNVCTIDASYILTLNTLTRTDGVSSIPLNNIKYSIDGTTTKLLSMADSNTENLEAVQDDLTKNNIGTIYDNQSKILATGTLKSGERTESVTTVNPGESKTFNLWLWIDYDATTAINGFKYTGVLSVVSSPIKLEEGT